MSQIKSGNYSVAILAVITDHKNYGTGFYPTQFHRFKILHVGAVSHRASSNQSKVCRRQSFTLCQITLPCYWLSSYEKCNLQLLSHHLQFALNANWHKFRRVEANEKIHLHHLNPRSPASNGVMACAIVVSFVR